MIDRSHFVLFIPLLVLTMALMSCQSKKTPEQVSEHFWLGMKTKNMALVKKYSLVNSINDAEELSQFENITDFSFGKIIIDDAVAEVETSVTTSLNQKKVDINLKTYLEKHNEIWKVNHRKTVLPLTVNQNMAEMFDDIEEITEELTGQIKESVEEIKEKIVPEMKSKAEEIKEKVIPEIESKIEQTEKEVLKKLPELKSLFDDFLHELEKSLEKLIPEQQQEEPKTQET
ncbi:MAG: hypothetical protein HND53_11230 [Proteobacteria bacterium]|nr:hypothetical protein [Pseudomonadota bacterium]NOG61065.1 hypothetical protein [Pseudomonadota bacterium]